MRTFSQKYDLISHYIISLQSHYGILSYEKASHNDKMLSHNYEIEIEP